MLGTNSEPGICARTLSDLFQAIEDTSGEMEYEVSMSYLEVWQGAAGSSPSLGRAGDSKWHAAPSRASLHPAWDAVSPRVPTLRGDMPSSFPLPRSTTR